MLTGAISGISVVDGWALAVSLVAAVLAKSSASIYLNVYRPKPNTVRQTTYLPFPLSLIGQIPDVLILLEPGVAQMRNLANCRAHGVSVGIVHNLGKVGYEIWDRRDVEYLLLKRKVLKADYYRFLSPLFGTYGLVALEDEKMHSVHRRMLGPAFTTQALRVTYDTTVVKRVAEMATELDREVVERQTHVDDDEKGQDGAAQPKVKKIRQHGTSSGGGESVEMELEKPFDNFALNVISEAAFREVHVDGLNVGEEFHRMVTSLASSPQIFIPGCKDIPTAPLAAMKRAANNVRTISIEMIRRAREMLVTEESGRRLLVDYLAEARAENAFNDEAVADHALTFLLAGHETTSTTMTWCTYLLAKHPEVQKRLSEEVSAAFAFDTVPSLDTVQQLQLLNNVIKETLRLLPPVAGLSRKTSEDEFLPYAQVYIPKGAEIVFNMYGMMRDPAIWGADADDFRPDRWNDTEFIETHVGQGAYMPFFLGKRNCIGKDFAINELLACLAVFVRRFSVAWPAGAREPKRQTKLTMRPRDAIRLLVTRRDDEQRDDANVRQ